MNESTAMIPAEQNGLANGLDDDAIEVYNDPAPMSLALKAEVDMQITTAKAYPRSIKAFKDEALGMATLDEETASSCMYALPRAGKNIEGPSVRLAEIIATAWGNLRTEARVIGADAKEITAEATTWDLEKNVAMRIQSKRRITDKHGKRFKDDMITVTGNAAVSIALRNSIFRVIPKAFTDAIYRAARQVAIGDAMTLSTRRVNAVENFTRMGVVPEKVFERLGRASIEEITLDDLALMKGFYTAIKDGAASVDEIFNPEEFAAASVPNAGVAALKDRLPNKAAEEQPPAATDETKPADEPPAVDVSHMEEEPAANEAEPPATVEESAPAATEDESDAKAIDAEEVDPLESLRANVRAALDELPASKRKNLIAGKPLVGEMTEDELKQMLADATA